MRNEYRVIEDSYNGFEAQVRLWWFPVWAQLSKYGGLGSNTVCTIEEAEQICRKHASGGNVAKYLGRLP